MLHYEVIDIQTLNLLKRLQSLQSLLQTRLVGGTSLALQYGHRKSVDLDLFGKVDFDEEVYEEIHAIGNIVIDLKRSRNINIFLIDGIKVDIVNYRYNWLRPALREGGLTLSSKEDIAALKINAIIGRGSRKDFIDIAFLLKEFSLADILRLYEQKYPEASLFLAGKSLAYYDDADKDPMPDMLHDISWNEIKKYISEKYEEFENNH